MLRVECDVVQTTFLPVITNSDVITSYAGGSPVHDGLDTQGAVFAEAEVIDVHLAIHSGQDKHGAGQGGPADISHLRHIIMVIQLIYLV